jgi:rubrerythrin
MADACNCDESNLIRVFDRNMDQIYIPGNPYARICTGCGKRKFCSEERWQNADQQYVIPNGDDEPIRREEFSEYSDVNIFDCPECGYTQFGMPSQCDACGQDYDWPDD